MGESFQCPDGLHIYVTSAHFIVKEKKTSDIHRNNFKSLFHEAAMQRSKEDILGNFVTIY